jgi:hypothetical protein
MDCFGFVYSDGTSENSCGGTYAGLDTADFCRNGCTNCGAGNYYCQNGGCDGKLTLPTGEYITELTQYTNAGSASGQLSATGLRVKTSAGKDTLLKGHGYTEENPNVVTGSLTFNSKNLQTVAGESCGQATTTTQAAGSLVGYEKLGPGWCCAETDASKCSGYNWHSYTDYMYITAETVDACAKKCDAFQKVMEQNTEISCVGFDIKNTVESEKKAGTCFLFTSPGTPRETNNCPDGFEGCDFRHHKSGPIVSVNPKKNDHYTCYKRTR